MLTVVPDLSAALPAGEPSPVIDQIVREGARQMLAAALQAEVAAYIDQFAGVCDENGRRLVVRNGTAEPRTVLTSAGAVEVTAPRVNDKRTDPATGERARFSSAILPPWARKTPQVAEVLPLLYLHGLSSSDFGPALAQFLGTGTGLSAPVITRLTQTWTAEATAFAARDLSGADCVYLWVDGIHLGIRLGEGKLCLLVMIGVRADGRKELAALADGYREPAESWADLLRDCARRGMRAPVLAIGDGALGFWTAVREVFPQARTQRCWFHKIANVLGALPKSAHPGAKKALAEIWNAEDKDHARAAVKAFAAAYGAKFPQGRSQGHRRRGRAAGVLRLSRGALDPPAHGEPDRIYFRHRAAPDQGHQGPRVEGRRAGDGVQADRVRPAPLADGERPAPGRARPCRFGVRQRQARRAPG
jgi:transposase-like protein